MGPYFSKFYPVLLQLAAFDVAAPFISVSTVAPTQTSL
jgi:hypothetical protein